MKKFIVVILSFIIVLLSFALCFADGSPIILPIGDENDSSSGLRIDMNDGTVMVYRASDSPVYLTHYHNPNGTSYKLLFSESPNVVVYQNRISPSTGPVSTDSLNSQYNGFYFVHSISNVPLENYFIEGEYSSPNDVIDYVNNTVFNTTFDLTYLIDGSVSWVSSMAQAVKTNGLLLFFVLFIFVGVGIGLFKRFTN